MEEQNKIKMRHCTCDNKLQSNVWLLNKRIYNTFMIYCNYIIYETWFSIILIIVTCKDYSTWWMSLLCMSYLARNRNIKLVYWDRFNIHHDGQSTMKTTKEWVRHWFQRFIFRETFEPLDMNMVRCRMKSTK